MKFKLDENFGTRTQSLFLSKGHDVGTACGQGLGGATDSDLYRICSAEGRCLRPSGGWAGRNACPHEADRYFNTTFSTSTFSTLSETRTAMVCSPGEASGVRKL